MTRGRARSSWRRARRCPAGLGQGQGGRLPGERAAPAPRGRAGGQGESGPAGPLPPAGWARCSGPARRLPFVWRRSAHPGACGRRAGVCMCGERRGARDGLRGAAPACSLYPCLCEVGSLRALSLAVGWRRIHRSCQLERRAENFHFPARIGGPAGFLQVLRAAVVRTADGTPRCPALCSAGCMGLELGTRSHSRARRWAALRQVPVLHF